MTDVTIVEYNDNAHRNQVIGLWKSVFGYSDTRNNPSLVIDKKIETDNKLFFVAIHNQSVIGTVMAGYDGHRGWIYSLSVQDSMRRQNIGTRLLKHAENELTVLGCVKINLQILEANNPVKSFYEKNGYGIEARINMGKEIKENIIAESGL